MSHHGYRNHGALILASIPKPQGGEARQGRGANPEGGERERAPRREQERREPPQAMTPGDSDPAQEGEREREPRRGRPGDPDPGERRGASSPTGEEKQAAPNKRDTTR